MIPEATDTGRRSRGARALWSLVAALLAVTAAGCGVPESGAARTVASGDVPSGLLGTASASPGPRRSVGDSHGPGVYFVRSERLVRVALDVGGAARNPTQLASVLAALTAGPNTAEQAVGLGSAIPPGLGLDVRSLVDGVAQVELRGETAHPDVTRNPLAVGQLVLTATSVPGVRGVRLHSDGQDVSAVLPDGTLASRAVNAVDYLPLLTPSPDATSPDATSPDPIAGPPVS